MAAYRLAGACLSIVGFVFTACGQSGPTVWVSPSLEKVGINAPAGSTNDASISAGRNETESFQIVVGAKSSNLTNVRVRVSNLTGPGGSIISSASISLFREFYVHVSPSSVNWQGSNQPLGAGWYADALIPFIDPETGSAPNGAIKASPFPVSPGQNQPVWVDVKVPSSATPGNYSGTYTVTSDQGSSSGSISLTVWHFTLPNSPALHSAFGYWTAGTPAAQRELLRNRIAPLNVTPSDEPQLMSTYGLSQTNIGLWSGAQNGYCNMPAAPSVAAVRTAASKHQSSLMLFDFSADEIGACTNLYPTIKSWGYNLHQAGIKNMVTMTPNSALYDDGSGTGRSAVDIWTLLPILYDANPSAVKYVLGKGDSVWSTNAVVQDGYSPKWMIDFGSTNLRVQPGFINQSLGLTGLMYWQVDRWRTDPWSNVNNTGQLSSNNYPGEGLMVYPGADVGLAGVAPSIRLKWIRDGVDDYDYIQLLKQSGYGSWAIQIANSVGQNWSNWTQDPAALESAREQLGQKLDSISGGTPAAPATGPVSLSPSSGSGDNAHFTAVFSATSGYSSLAGANLMINSGLSGANACWIAVSPGSNQIWLANNAGSSWASATLGSSTQLTNSQCTVQASGARVSGSGSNLTVSVPLIFNSSFKGAKTVYGQARTSSTSGSYEPLGTWSVQ